MFYVFKSKKSLTHLHQTNNSNMVGAMGLEPTRYR